jgi:long-chain acyl-CoA synthetase
VQSRAEGRRSLSYETLATDVARYAQGLADEGLEAGEFLLLFAGGGPDWITAFLATIAARAVPIPLDTQTDEQTLRHILDDSGAGWAVVDSARAATLEDAGFEGRVIRIDNEAAEESDARTRREYQANASRDWPAFEKDDMAVLFYTSGTTGPPKGVPLTHGNVAFQLSAVIAAGLVEDDDRVLQPLPPHHVYPLIVGTLAPLALGLTIVIPEAVLGPQLVAALKAEDVTFIIGVPRLYEALVEAIESRLENQRGPAGLYLRSALRLCLAIRRKLGWRLGKALLAPLHRRLAPRLRVLASGGAALDPGVALKIEALGWRVASGYGLTETSPLLTLNPPGSGRLKSAGRPIPGIELRIDTEVTGADDNEDDEDRARVGEGEILARGDSVFDGYLHHEKDAESFTDDGWFRTADLGRIDDEGCLYVTGRRNTLLVTSSGKNIQPDELEQRYAEHELIEEIGLLMDDKRRLVAVVVPARAKVRERNVSAENAVRMALSQQGHTVASYKRVQRHVLSHDPLPRTRLGKIQRHKLVELYQTLKANPEHQAPRAEPVPIEDMRKDDRRLLGDERVEKLWRLLAERYPQSGLSPDSGLQSDLGVDSLGWLELGTEISQRIGVGIDEEAIAGIDTVRDLLETVARSSTESAHRDTPIERPEDYLSEDQQRWLEPLSPAARRAADFLYALHGAAVRRLFRVSSKGLEHLPAERQWIIAPNHASFLDPSVIAAVLPRDALADVYWAGWTGYAFRNIFFRGVSRLAQVIPIDQDRAASSSLAFAAAVLERGKHLVLFPEGERSSTGELLELKPGLGMLAEHFSAVAVVPVWISGSLDAWPRDRSLPRRKPISVTVGEPLSPRVVIEKTPNTDSVRAITNTLREALEALRP